MSDDATRAILAAVQSGDMTPSIAADLIGKMGEVPAPPEAAPEPEAPEEPLTPAQLHEQAAQQFIAQLQAANNTWVSLSTGD